MILVNGRIVMEEYFDGHTQDAIWQWKSAGKTLEASITGIAEQEGLIGINTVVSQNMGKGWTSAPREKEDLITSRHLLTISSGLKDSQLLTPATFSYMPDAPPDMYAAKGAEDQGIYVIPGKKMGVIRMGWPQK